MAKHKQLIVNMPEDMHDAIKRLAFRDGKTISSLVRELINERLNQAYETECSG